MASDPVDAGKATSPEGQMAPPPDTAELEDRLRQLEEENARLRQMSDQAVAMASSRKGRGRNAGAIALVLIAAFIAALAVPAVWLNRMISDTDVYVRTVAPLAGDPDIQKVVASAASDAIIEKVDAQNRLKELLPENLRILAVPAGQAVDSFIEKQSLRLVQSDQFASAWETINRTSHRALITAVTGRDTGVVGIEAGVIALDVGAVIDEVASRLEGAGLGFVSNLPLSGIDKRIVLYESPVLAQTTTVFDAIARVAFMLPFLGLVLMAGGVALAADRRRAVLWLGAALAVFALLPLQALYFGQTYAAQQLYELASIPTPAAQSAFDIVFRDLVTADHALVALGVVLWLGALIAGPARWAVAVRTGISGGLGGVASHLELGTFGEWVRGHKKGLRAAGIAGAFAILALLPAPRTVGNAIALGVAYVVWVLLVELFGAEPTAVQQSGAAAEAEDAEPDPPAAAG